MTEVKQEYPQPSYRDNVDIRRYIHQPLMSSSDIRLIKLRPYEVEDGLRENRAEAVSSLSVDLVHTALDSAPSFVAVSYTWGNPTRDHAISTFKGESLYVTQNVQSILQRLRPEADDGPCYFWIDQICINQQNEGEKWKQIRIMRHIYERAIGTCIFLNDADDAADALLQTMGGLEVAPLCHLPTPFREPPLISQHSLAVLANASFRERFLGLVNDVIFSRGWVYQEVVSSKFPYLLGQMYRIQWDTFAAVLTVCLNIEALKPDWRVIKSRRVRTLCNIVNDRIIRQAGAQKDWMLLHTEAQGLLKCSDLRDITIALTTFEDWYEEIPEYHRYSIASLYRMSTSAMINASKSLDVFAAVSGHWHYPSRENEGMPSWVPDWSRARDSVPLCWPNSETTFNAANGYSHEYIETESRRMLLVHGKKVDTLRTLVDRRYEEDDDEPSVVKYLCLQMTCHYYSQHTERAGHRVEAETLEERQELAQNMLAAMTASFVSYTSFTTDGFVGPPPVALFYNELCWMVAYYDEIMEDEAPLYHNGRPHFLSFMPRTYGGWKAAMSKFRQWASICSGRRIAFGESQGFGLVPKASRCGDFVCVLHGSKVPIIVRRLGRCFRVIGQCYWHGWMYGDKVDWGKDDADLFKLV